MTTLLYANSISETFVSFMLDATFSTLSTMTYIAQFKDVLFSREELYLLSPSLKRNCKESYVAKTDYSRICILHLSAMLTSKRPPFQGLHYEGPYPPRRCSLAGCTSGARYIILTIDLVKAKLIGGIFDGG